MVKSGGARGLSLNSLAILRVIFDLMDDEGQPSVALSDALLEARVPPSELRACLHQLVGAGYIEKGQGSPLARPRNFDQWTDYLMPISGFAEKAKSYMRRDDNQNDVRSFLMSMEQAYPQLFLARVQMTSKGIAFIMSRTGRNSPRSRQLAEPMPGSST